MNTNETTISHYGQWIAVAIWVIMFGIFLLFTPFYKKSQRKPSGVYLAFIIAMAFEMFGVPMSMYILSWVLGKAVPEGIFWGHTLVNQIGLTGLYIAYGCFALGILLVVLGWKEVFRRYWSKEEGKGELVINGIYRFIRHPQYTGFMLITLGMLCEWATIPLLIMWPILTVLYYKLAKREEAEMEQQFGEAYRQYRSRTGMFLPRLLPARAASTQAAWLDQTSGAVSKERLDSPVPRNNFWMANREYVRFAINNTFEETSMENTPPTSTPPTYEIQFRGQLDERRAGWFEGMKMMHLPDGNTLLTGQLPDQPALHGILSRIRDLGLELLSVRRIPV